MEQSIRKVLIIFVKIYQKTLSPFFWGGCRFYPSCSSYAVQALEKKSLRIAIKMIFSRLFRCHPGNLGGIDLVLEEKKNDE